ncbi:MAG: hypothetical protein GY701_31710 [Sulfitobacter sp.]|nr:hypothetical protein [Sulfitobacter sp.]
MHIELGRYNGVKLNERVCNVCSSGAIEDEVHFLFHCCKYDDARKRFFESTGIRRVPNEIDTLKCLLEENPRILSKYILKLLEIRKEYV